MSRKLTRSRRTLNRWQSPGFPTPDASPQAGRPAAQRAARAGAWIRLLRPAHWLKNGFVLVPLVFSRLLTSEPQLLTALATFCLFSVTASGVYAWNDVLDLQSDRAHPRKRLRPVAAGLIAPKHAVMVAALLTGTGLLGAFMLNADLAGVLLAYVLLNLLYNYYFKRKVLLDIFCIASFFVLRLLAGAAALDVQPSIWLLLCGGLLALYMATSKRRQELILLAEQSAAHRSVLSLYDPGLLDLMSMVLLSVVIVAYVMYTLDSETAMEVGRNRLAYSSVFVLYGVFRYLYATRKSEHGGDPTETVISDGPLMLAVILWFLYCTWAVYGPR